MSNHKIDNKGTLSNEKGDIIGKVDNDGSVYDGHHQKGNIDSDGRYINEFGQNKGWAVGSVSNDSSGVEATGCFFAAIIAIIVALIAGIVDPKHRKTALIIFGLLMMPTLCMIILFLGPMFLGLLCKISPGLCLSILAH